MKSSLPPERGNRSTCSGAPEGATGAFCARGIVRGARRQSSAAPRLSPGQGADQLRPRCQGTFCPGGVQAKIPRKRTQRWMRSGGKILQACTRHLAFSCYKNENNCESREKSAAAPGYSYRKRSHQALFIVAVLANYFLITHNLFTSVAG